MTTKIALTEQEESLVANQEAYLKGLLGSAKVEAAIERLENAHSVVGIEVVEEKKQAEAELEERKAALRLEIASCATAGDDVGLSEKSAQWQNLVGAPVTMTQPRTNSEAAKSDASTHLIVSAVKSMGRILGTVKLGTVKTVDDLYLALKIGDVRVGNWARDIMSRPKFTLAAKETEVELAVVSGAELGFSSLVARQDIYEQAQKYGLERCPAEAAPQACLQLKSMLAVGEVVYFGMEPITDSDGCLGVFDVGRDGGGLWLGSFYDDPGNLWGAGDRWGFLRRK